MSLELDNFQRIATALTQHANTGGVSNNTRLSEPAQEKGKEHIAWPSPEALMELYTKLLRDSQDPKIREVMSDQSSVVSNFATSLAEKLEQQLGSSRQQQLPRQKMPCGCGVDHGDQDQLDFPDDSYEDEPDEEGFDSEEEDDDGDEDDDEDEDDEDYDDEDDEDDDDDDDDDDDYDEVYDEDLDHDIFDGYSHHYASNSIEALALEEEKRMFASISQLRNDKNLLEEGLRKKQQYDAQKKKQEEEERIRLLQRLRLEDEERRRREQQEKERKERLEQELRKKREAAEADQAARSFLFINTSKSNVEVVKTMVEASPAESESIAGIPKFTSTSTTRLTGWEYIGEEGGGKGVSEKSGLQETLLHVAARVGCFGLVSYFIAKGAPLDALDSDGRIPLHTAAKHNASPEVCKLLIEKAAYYIDRHSIKSGKTALHYAAQNGCGDLVAMLLQHHARVNVVDAEGNTPEMLAKAGLDREKSSKARAQKYRGAIHHIQKSLAAIKEAQRQKDALLEEQRKKEEELAKEEAEKDKAARRKQEEKLEADQRRREEEEKELARLKASVADPHGHSGTGSKKKKKKKGKANNEVQQPHKEILSDKTLSSPAPAYSVVAKSTSPSPMGSPSISQAPLSIQKLSSQPSAHTSGSTKMSALSSSTPSNAKNSSSTSVPPSDAKPLPSSSVSESSKLAKPTNDWPSPPRLPKVKTNYRPSQLVVARMVDMGFQQRDSRKALIQTEGKVEEAIELLTSGAPLADDSEDEAEKAALEAARRKVVAEKAVASTPTVKEQNSSVKAPVIANPQPPQSQTAPITLTSKPSAPLQSPPSQQSPSKTSAPKKPAAIPIQILNRPPVLLPHVQMRVAPTQVLQRSSMQARVSPASSSNKPSTSQDSSTSSQTTSGAVAAPSAAPFLAQRSAPPLPPTRAPYSYGSSSTQDQSQPFSTATIPSSVHHRRHDSRGANDLSLHSLPVTGSDYIRSPNVSTGWNTGLSVQNSVLSNVSEAPLVAQNTSWGMVAPTNAASTFENNSISFQSLSSTSALTAVRRSSLELLTASMSEMLRQSQMDMDGDTDNDMIRDVLAMTGAIDPDDLESTLSNFPLADSSSSESTASRVTTRPSIAVGEGRNQPSLATRNPVASLWEYGSFTQDISSISQSWSLSPSQRGLAVDENNIRDYNQWNSSSGIEVDKAMHQMQYQGSSSPLATDRQQAYASSYINHLFGSPSSPHASLMPGTPGTVPVSRSIQTASPRPTAANNNNDLSQSVGANSNTSYDRELSHQIFDFNDSQYQTINNNLGQEDHYSSLANQSAAKPFSGSPQSASSVGGLPYSPSADINSNLASASNSATSPISSPGSRHLFISLTGSIGISQESELVVGIDSSRDRSLQPDYNVLSPGSQSFNNGFGCYGYPNLNQPSTSPPPPPVFDLADTPLTSTSNTQCDRWKTRDGL
ncbi:Palmitoyltransferase zdhhc13 [Mortierella sp. AD010]|nr:Palmitoyltransferase zdhhc13 [Mortierella sp. AD010]